MEHDDVAVSAHFMPSASLQTAILIISVLGATPNQCVITCLSLPTGKQPVSMTSSVVSAKLDKQRSQKKDQDLEFWQRSSGPSAKGWWNAGIRQCSIQSG